AVAAALAGARARVSAPRAPRRDGRLPRRRRRHVPAHRGRHDGRVLRAAWVAEYARRLREMMTAYLRNGTSLVYWVSLPAPRDAGRVVSHDAINGAIAQAAATFADGVRVIDLGPA